LVFFHLSIWNPSTIYPHLNLLHLLSPPSTPNTVPILQSCLLLLIFKPMLKGIFSLYLCCGILYFGPFNSFHFGTILIFIYLISSEIEQYI
jgi:hypothetical protein